MHAWNFTQTFALMWIGEQSFRCIDPTQTLRITIHNQLIQVSVSLLAPVYTRRQIVPIAAPLEQICVSINISLHWREKDKRPDIDLSVIWLLTTLYIYLDTRTHLYLFWKIFSLRARTNCNGKERKHTLTNLDWNIYRWRCDTSTLISKVNI